MEKIDQENRIGRHTRERVSVDYEKGIHRYWIKAVSEGRPHQTQEVIDCIKHRFERGLISEAQLMELEKEFESSPHAFIETLLYCRFDFDD